MKQYRHWLSVVFMVVISATVLFSGCDSNDETPDGDIVDGDTDTEAEAEDEALSCENPAPIWDTPWEPPSPYTETHYPQKKSTIIADLPQGAVTDLAVLSDGTTIAVTTGGLVSIATDNSATAITGWDMTTLQGIAAADDSGAFAAFGGDTLYVGTLAAAPVTTLQHTAAIKQIAPVPGGGVWMLDVNGTVIRYAADGTEELSFPQPADMSITRIIPGPDENALLLATDSGAHILHVDSQPYQTTYATPGITDPGAVTDIYVVSATLMWLTTPEGLIKYENDAATLLTGQQGMPYLNAAGIAATADGTLLIASDKGLMTYMPDTGAWDYYHSRHWLPDWGVHRAMGMADGSLMVATEAGVARLYKEAMTLEDKAAILDLAMYTRHNRFGQFSRCMLETPGDLSTAKTWDDDNDGQWTNMYMASQAFRYAATGSAEAKQYAQEALEGMLRLLTVSGLKGFMARSVIEPEKCPGKQDPPDQGEWHLSDDEQWCWKGDTSSDEFVGYAFGIPLYYDLVADEQEKQRIATIFGDWLWGIVENGYMLIDLDGKPTSHSHFDPRWIDTIGQGGDAGLNGAMMLGALRAAYHMTGDEKFLDSFYYLAIDNYYAENVSKIIEICHRAHINHDAEEMSYLAMVNLIRYETDPCLMAMWQKGLKDMHATQVKENNPEFNFLHAWLTRDDQFVTDASVATLQQWYLNNITWASNNSHRADFELDPDLDRFDDAQSLAVFPYDQNATFRWSKNPFTLDRGGRGTQEEMLTPWLLPYWLGRYTGLIRQ